MAEFNKVARHRNRMCKSTTLCMECALSATSSVYGCASLMLDNPMEYERIVLEWAAEHPEPQFPTWEQWHSKIFPMHGSQSKILPCLFISKEDGACGSDVEYEDAIKKCNVCRKQRIPADIASKLGIKPGEEW